MRQTTAGFADAAGGEMPRFALIRLLRGLLTMWLVVTAVFIGLRLSGDPAQAMLGDESTPEQRAAFERQFGLDEPIPVQYVLYITNLARGNFGLSLSERRPVVELVGRYIGATARLALAAIAIALLLGIPAGILAAVWHDSPLDRGLMALAFIGQSAPNFFVGILLILLFSLQLRWLPSNGSETWQHLLLPAFTLATGLLAALARMTRSALLEVLRMDYMRVARAKGLGPWRVVVGHALRNAAIPVVTIFGLSVGVMIGGAAITETVFAWPGIGRLAVTAITIRDYPVIQVIVLLVAVSVVAINLLVDLVYGWLDPRIRERA
jgi:peptide/nickel transport system permease protein